MLFQRPTDPTLARLGGCLVVSVGPLSCQKAFDVLISEELNRGEFPVLLPVPVVLAQELREPVREGLVLGLGVLHSGAPSGH